MRAVTAIRIILEIQNWLDVYRSILFGVPLKRILLRGGVVLEAPASVELWNHFNDIWLHKTYTGQGFEINRGATVIDIGANIGIFSVLAAQRASCVYSYEPYPPAFEHLVRNIRSNNLRNVKTYAAAVTAQSGERRLHIRPQSTENTLLLGENPDGNKGGASLPVPCVKLADILEDNSISRCEFLKMDCEGSEFEIIFNTPKHYLQRFGVICLECHNGLTPFSHVDLQRHLEGVGFKTAITAIRGETAILRAKRRMIQQ